MPPNLTLLVRPSLFGICLISPMRPCKSEVFPDPTAPTTATSFPRGIVIETFLTWKIFSNVSVAGAFSLELDFPFDFLLSSTSGGGASQVNVTSSTSSALGSLSSRSIRSSSSSASNTPCRRSVAFHASAIVASETAIVVRVSEITK